MDNKAWQMTVIIIMYINTTQNIKHIELYVLSVGTKLEKAFLGEKWKIFKKCIPYYVRTK